MEIGFTGRSSLSRRIAKWAWLPVGGVFVVVWAVTTEADIPWWHWVLIGMGVIVVGGTVRMMWATWGEAMSGDPDDPDDHDIGQAPDRRDN